MKKKTLFRLIISLIPVILLVAMMVFIISVYGGDAICGGSQVALIISSGICIWLSSWLLKTPWKKFEDEIKDNISDLSMTLLILLMIGALSGAWTTSGIVPSFIYYGIQIINPKFFLISACLICAFVSIATGSSWTTIATIGVALLGIGKALGFSGPVIAGAIISGSYFGDKVSPLSDTTVLASSVNNVPLFSHIRYLMITTVPSFVIALIVFAIMGISHDGSDPIQIASYTEGIKENFNLSPWLMLVPLLTIVMIAKKMPAVVVLALSALNGIIFALIFQPEIIHNIGSSVNSGSYQKVQFIGAVEALYNSTSIDTGNPELNSLVSTRGMRGMLNTVYLVICSMCFGSCMKASGMLHQLASLILPFTKKRVSLVTSTVGTGIVMNGLMADQYLSIILTSNIFKEIYEKEGYDPKLLGRSIEDSSTITSPLIPWNSCGMTQSTILGVSTMAYAPYCIFNYLSPLASILISIIGYKITRKPDRKAKELQ